MRTLFVLIALVATTASPAAVHAETGVDSLISPSIRPPAQMARPAPISAPSSVQASGPVAAADAPPARPLPASYPRPPARDGDLPRTRWSDIAGHALWNRVALSALKTHGRPLTDMVPADIAEWCPLYPTATPRQRRAFWVGLMSTLAKYESTYKEVAVGGGGRWYGLLQILPSTARSYKCNANSGEQLKRGGANLSCAVRIMARTVPRDGVIAGKNGRWLGVAADWGPMRSDTKRRDMAIWLKKQPYCRSPGDMRPRARPVTLASN